MAGKQRSTRAAELLTETMNRVEVLISMYSTAAALAEKVHVDKATVTKWRTTGRIAPDKARLVDKEAARLNLQFQSSFVELRLQLDVAELTERAGVRFPPGPVVPQPVREPAELYRLAAKLIADAKPAPQDRELLVTTLLGHSGTRRQQPSDGLSASRPGAAYRKAFHRVVTSTKEPWQVRHLFTVPNRAQLDDVLTELAVYDGAPAYEVRCIPASKSGLTVLAPLVIARQHALLGLDDPREYRLGSALHLEGRQVAAWLAEYFQRLWDISPVGQVRAYRIRELAGLNSSEIDALANALK